jgi:hypothetical protein
VEPFAQAVESWHDFLSDDWHGNSNLDRFFVDINDHCSFGVARLYPQSVMARISDDPIDFGCHSIVAWDMLLRLRELPKGSY